MKISSLLNERNIEINSNDQRIETFLGFKKHRKFSPYELNVLKKTYEQDPFPTMERV